jgi:hypothetical protein
LIKLDRPVAVVVAVTIAVAAAVSVSAVDTTTVAVADYVNNKTMTMYTSLNSGKSW